MLEAFRELQRLPAAQAKGADFLALARAAEDAARGLGDAIGAKAADKTEAGLHGVHAVLRRLPRDLPQLRRAPAHRRMRRSCAPDSP